MTDPDARKEIFVFKGQAVTNYFRVSKGFPGDSVGKESACNAGDPARFNPWVMKMPWRREVVEKGSSEKATHSSILAWWIPWTKEPSGLQSMRSQRVRHNWATNTFTFKGQIHILSFWADVPDAYVKIRGGPSSDFIWAEQCLSHTSSVASQVYFRWLSCQRWLHFDSPFIPETSLRKLSSDRLKKFRGQCIPWQIIWCRDSSQCDKRQKKKV